MFWKLRTPNVSGCYLFFGIKFSMASFYRYFWVKWGFLCLKPFFIVEKHIQKWSGTWSRLINRKMSQKKGYTLTHRVCSISKSKSKGAGGIKNIAKDTAKQTKGTFLRCEEVISKCAERFDQTTFLICSKPRMTSITSSQHLKKMSIKRDFLGYE